jgi:hypothetical protein
MEATHLVGQVFDLQGRLKTCPTLMGRSSTCRAG